MATRPENPKAPIALTFEAIDELIYDARLGDLDALQAEIEKLSREYNASASAIIRSAIDTEEESEGGTGACLLHWPAANGNVELLTFLLQTLQQEGGEDIAAFINFRNHSGNTPLHWAALNTHLDCVKALVEAGADVGAKNDAGHDALFLAERVDWSSEPEVEEKGEGGEENGEGENGKKEEGEEEQAPPPPPSKARQVVEWLLGCDKGARFEAPVGNGDGNGNSAEGDTTTNVTMNGHDEMEGVEETNATTS
ncbi:hypothetical protein VTN77DRAFT_2709 [Rasamsonia byssochlamydoides]|uniref:uncharacterized protein n=1 Tax=Rasamsonia byssochlamydoides TaxID=89139 RepID=UPI0037422CB5